MSFVTYRQSFDVSLLHELGATFKAHNIPYQIDDHTMQFDVSYANNQFEKDYRLKILQKDFVQADELLADYYVPLVADAPADYYLFSFSKIELMDIIRKPDAWGDFDKVLAKKILKDRGHEITTATEETLYQQRLQKLAAPDRDDFYWVLAGYVLAFIGPIIGFCIGWYLAKHKKNLPNGEVVFACNEKDRESGKLIMLISVLFTILFVVLRMMYLSSSKRAFFYF
jgi:hypothetical protein